jgi:hypothetical protein
VRGCCRKQDRITRWQIRATYTSGGEATFRWWNHGDASNGLSNVEQGPRHSTALCDTLRCGNLRGGVRLSVPKRYRSYFIEGIERQMKGDRRIKTRQ